MGIFQTSVSVVNKFLTRFSGFFSRKQMIVFTLAVYSLFREYKRNTLAAMAQAANVEYQAFQYFFSDSKWDPHDLEEERLEIIESQRTTASTPSGALLIDDTGCPKPHAEKTEGAAYQYCPPTGREEVCNVAVASAFCSPTKRFPISFRFYTPADQLPHGKDNPTFKSKVELAEELFLHAIDHNIKFYAVSFDSWYASTRFFLLIDSKGRIFVTEVKSNRKILMYHPAKRERCFVQQDELVTLVKKHYPHKIRYVHFRSPDGTQKSLPTYTFKAKLKDCDLSLKFVLVFGKWNDEDDKDCHILVTNDTRMSYSKIVSTHRLRWGIEKCFRELKDTFYFDHYQVRHRDKIERYWSLILLAWTLTYWIKQNGYLKRTVHSSPNTLGEYKKAIQDMINYTSVCTLSKNKELAEEHFKIKSANFKATARAA